MTEEKQKKIFSENLKKIINDKGVEQVQIATQLKVTPSTFNGWVKSRAIPSLWTLRRLSEYLGVSIYDLIEEKPKNDLIRAAEPFLTPQTVDMLSKFQRTTECRQIVINELLALPNR